MLNCNKIQKPPLISTKGRGDSYVLLLSTQNFEKESCKSLTTSVQLRHLRADAQHSSNKTRRKITSLTMQLCSTSINQLLAQPYTHTATILPHQSAVVIQASLHSPRQHLTPQKTTARRNLPYPVITCSPMSLLNHLCDLDSLLKFVHKLGQLEKTCMILENREKQPH